MKTKRFSVEQIVAVLKRAERGMPVADLTWRVGHLRADVLSLEEAVCRAATGPGAGAEPTAGRLKKLVAELTA
jgi:putative transposase